MKTVFVLLLWFGDYHGGAAAIDGFASKASCEDFAARIIAKQEKGMFNNNLKGFRPLYGSHCEEKEPAQ